MRMMIKDFDVSFSAAKKFEVRKRPDLSSRGVHAQICARLMSKPQVWAKVATKSGKPLSQKAKVSLQTAIHAGSRFGLVFQTAQEEDGHIYVRYVGARD